MGDSRIGLEKKDEYNGLFLSNVYIPVEILRKILRYVDTDTLFTSHLVCKRWHDIIKNTVWRERAEIAFNRPLPKENISWRTYFSMSFITFGRNLLRNASGEQEFRNWETPNIHRWMVTRADYWPNPQLPKIPFFKKNTYCFVPGNSLIFQRVHLIGAGFTRDFLDLLQPPIEVGIWYVGKPYSNYQLIVYIHNDQNELITKFEYNTPSQEDHSKEWHNVSFVFRNYGPGLAIANFCHRGTRWCRVAGAHIRVMAPESLPNNFDDAMVDLLPNLHNWRKRAERIFKHNLPFKKTIPDDTYYLMSKTVFNKNLMANSYGELGLVNWNMDDLFPKIPWESRQVSTYIPDLPRSRMLNGHKTYFICGSGSRHQNVNFYSAGYSARFINVFNPLIEVSLWFNCAESSFYSVWISLFRDNFSNISTMDFHSKEVPEHSSRWLRVRFIFEDYGDGVKYFRFSDIGTPIDCKVTGICVRLLPPENLPDNFEDAYN